MIQHAGWKEPGMDGAGVMEHGGPNYRLFKLILRELHKADHEIKKVELVRGEEEK